MNPKNHAIHAVRQAAQPLTGASDDYDRLLDFISDTRFALIGEATHGTHDFYRERAQLTKRLITEKGFSAVAVEADWPDAYRVNRYVRGIGIDPNAHAALGGSLGPARSSRSDIFRFPDVRLQRSRTAVPDHRRMALRSARLHAADLHQRRLHGALLAVGSAAEIGEAGKRN
jgi:hypothetical protein